MPSKKYFNVKIEFDKDKVDSIIQNTITSNGKGYVCSVESNNLTVANKDPELLEVMNNALVNICDGSILALLISVIHRKEYHPYIGADLFIKYVRMCRYRQYYLGNTTEILNGLKRNLSKYDPAVENMIFETLPFKNVDDFDYENIAKKINDDKPDIIWVSLGAPKQEFFMNKLLKYLDKGVMFGFGAIFNFNAGAGTLKRAPAWMLKMKLEWLHRALEEPRKNIPRYLKFIKLLPILITHEFKNLHGM